MTTLFLLWRNVLLQEHWLYTNLMGDGGTSESRRKHFISCGCCRVLAADDEQAVIIISLNRFTQLYQADLL